MNLKDVALQTHNEVIKKREKSNREHREKRAKKAEEVFARQFGFEKLVDEDTLEFIFDDIIINWEESGYQVNFFYMGNCPYCGEYVKSNSVYSLESLGEELSKEKFEPHYNHTRYHCKMNNTKDSAQILAEALREFLYEYGVVDYLSCSVRCLQ